MSRPSPSESATNFKTGTIKKGNDKNMWIVTENINNVKRWKLYDKKKINNDDKIEQFKISPNVIKKKGYLNIESRVVVGEYNYSPSNGFSKFKKGLYYVYKIDDNLVLSKIKINKSFFKNALWIYQNVNVPVDGGSFGFWDMKILEKLNSYKNIITNKKKLNAKQDIPSYYNVWTKDNIHKTIFIKINDLNDDYYTDNEKLDKNKIIGVMTETGIGDGSFGCYVNTDNNVLLLMGGHTALNLYEKSKKNMPPNLKKIQKYKNTYK